MVHTFNSSGTLTIAGAGEYPVAHGSVFNTVLYTGTDTSHAITGVGFQPDFVWIKRRSSSEPHAIYDSIRGINKQLSSDSTLAEATNTSPYEGFTSFDSDGFTVDNNGGTNRAPNTYVAWCWKGGGTAVSNTNGTITSQVSANQAAGFSIVKYTGSTGNTSFGTGLTSEAEFIIFKRYTSAQNWFVFVKINNVWHYFEGLNNTNAAINYSAYMSATSTTVNLPSYNEFNQDTNSSYLAYCFHSVDGYQKVGSYSGNGTFQTINVGFTPRFVMIKAYTNSSSYTSWAMFDNQRLTSYNDTNPLYANLSAQEGTRGNGSGDGDVLEIIFVDGVGFKLGDASRSNGSDELNDSNNDYIYLAIA